MSAPPHGLPLAFALLALAAACTLVEDGEAVRPGPIRPAVALHVEPSAPTTHTGGTIRFHAIDDRGALANVTWSVGDPAAGGTVDAFGIYRAPALAGTYEVVATGAADPAQRATAHVTVREVAIEVAPLAAELDQGGTVALAATIEGADDAAVTWSAEAGEITADGLYTAPYAAGRFRVTATSVADPARAASATISVRELQIAVDPWNVTIDQGATTQLAAVVQNAADPRVTWTAEAGTVAPDGAYTAPFAAGTYAVRATSVRDGQASAAASVTVRDVSVALDPWWAEVDQGGTLPIAATLAGTVDPAVTWSASAGAVSPDGVFMAPLAPGDVVVTAASAADPNGRASMTVRVADARIEVAPQYAELPPGGSASFTAVVHGAARSAVVWSADGGTIDAAGVYTAPAAPGTYAITATRAEGEPQSAGAVAVVRPLALAYEDPPDSGGWRLVRNEAASGDELVVLDVVAPVGVRSAVLVFTLDASARWVESASDPDVRDFLLHDDAATFREAHATGRTLTVSLSVPDGGAVPPGTPVASVAIELASPVPFGTTLELGVTSARYVTYGSPERPVAVAAGTLTLQPR